MKLRRIGGLAGSMEYGGLMHRYVGYGRQNEKQVDCKVP